MREGNEIVEGNFDNLGFVINLFEPKILEK